MQTAALKTLVSIPTDHVALEGMLELPENAAGVVLFAHGSGSSRHSPRNNFVAEVLRRSGTGILEQAAEWFKKHLAAR
jgi:putative phosphoribosyl transferase